MMNSKKVLVVGAGFLGKEILNVFLSEGYGVMATRRSSNVIPELPQVETLQVDVLSEESLKKLPRNIDLVVYSVSADSRSSDQYKYAYSLGVENICNYYRDQEDLAVCFISSTGVYSENSGDWVTEDSELVDAKNFSSWIVSGEKFIRESRPNGHLILRFSGIYGGSRRRMCDYALSLSDDYVEENLHWTNRIHVKDGAKSVLHLFKNKYFGTYNITDTAPTTRSEIYSYIRSLKGKSVVKTLNQSVSTGKRCSNNKLCKTEFVYEYPSYREGYSEKF